MKDKLTYRQLALRKAPDGTPETLDESGRSVEVVGATERPVNVFDYEQGRVVPEILLMSGVNLPKTRQVPLLDSHERYSTSTVIGSYREMAFEGSTIVGRAVFSSDTSADSIWTKVREGHLTDFSIGYRVSKSQWVPDGKTRKIKGREFSGPVRIGTEWTVHELSAVPIGADEEAKARSKHKPKENDPMNEKLRAFLIAQGMNKDASDEETKRYLDDFDFTKVRIEAGGPTEPKEPKKTEPVDPAEVARKAVLDEQTRITEIQSMCERFEYPDDKARELVTGSVSIPDAREKVMNWIADKEPQGRGYREPIEMTADERDKFRSAAEDALALRTNIPTAGEKPAPGAETLRGYTLVEMARECLRRANVDYSGNSVQVVGRAITHSTSDFPYLLANVAHKSLFTGYEKAPETWSMWCDTGSVSDFKTHYSPRVSEFDGLDEVKENGEYTYSDRTEAQETYEVLTYGKMFSLSRQAIINDDTNALTKVPAGFGEAAARKVGDLVYAVLSDNPTMGDGNSLWDATNHSNYVAAGGGAAPGITTITAGELAMATQTDLQGLRTLNIAPQFIIAPWALKSTIEIMLNSKDFSDEDTVATDSSFASTRANPFYQKLTPVYDARIDNDDAAKWYLAAPKGKTITIFFLNGQQAPYLETQNGWSVDGVEWKVRIDAGAKAMDWRGLYHNDGN